jgi:hypothetical protein
MSTAQLVENISKVYPRESKNASLRSRLLGLRTIQRVVLLSMLYQAVLHTQQNDFSS